MDNQDTHVVQWLEENREDSEVGRDKSLASIFMVPITLRENDAAFTPHAISMGPYHFLKPQLAEMETEKSLIIARAVKRKLPSDFFSSHQMVRDGGSLQELEDNGFFGSVVPRCRDCYGDAQFLQNLNQEAFAMMLFRDASFLLLFLEHHVANPQKKKKLPHSQVPEPSDFNGDPFHDLKSGTRLWLAVKNDIIKLENQIPLSTLESLYALIGNPHKCYADFLAKVCSEYSPLFIKRSQNPDLVSKRHLLHCIHATVYYVEQPVDVGQGSPTGGRRSNGWSLSTWLKNNRPWVRGSNRNSKGYPPLGASLRNYAKTVLHSASQLSKAGVKFRPCREGGIENIRFDSAQSTLYLPQLKIGPMTETIIRNLIAFELCSPEIEENAVIGYTRLLKELTQDAKDAKVLRKNEIFANLGVGDEKMVEILKGLSSSTWKPYFKPVKEARKSLKAHYSRSRLKILLSEFLDTYCSKPWLLISALAATALLFMTAVQVLCLFYTCNKS